VALATALKKGGLTLQDVNFSQMAFPDMVVAFQNKGIDGGIVIEPFLSRVVSDGTGVRWKGNLEIFGGNEQVAAIVYGEQFAARVDVAQRWMNAYIRGVRDYNDAFGPKKKGYDDVVNILVANTTVKDPKVFAQMKPAGLNPDGKLDLQSMKSDLTYYVESGQAKPTADLTKLIDPTFQETAIKLLGPYLP
jgi:NitT/TauT family transport system substrate-binding protein